MLNEMQGPTLKISQSIMIDGHEYVITDMDVKASIGGRSVIVMALDKESADRQQQKMIKSENAADAQADMIQTVAKIVQNAIQNGGNMPPFMGGQGGGGF